jgi:putative endonuclease
MGWYVYILRCRDGTLYTGIAVDLRRRFEAHQRGLAAKYTRSRRPVSLVYQEPQADRSSALKREAGLRRLGRAEKLALIGALPSPWGDARDPVGPDQGATTSLPSSSRGTSVRSRRPCTRSQATKRCTRG